MLYTIAEVIVFNSDDGTLTRIQDDEVVKLSIPASRLFEVLLNAPGGFLDRESLLTEVWDKYGLRGSHGNLNQYVSILRRTLAMLGCEKLIVTVPKMGFRLNLDISVTVSAQTPLPEAHSVVIDVAPDGRQGVAALVEPIPQQVVVAPPSSSGSFLCHPFALIFMLALVLFLGGFSFIKYREWSIREISPVRSMIDDKCAVIYLQNIGPEDRRKVNKQVSEILRENHLQCDNSRLVLVDNNISDSTTNMGRTLLSFCRLGSDNKVVDCQNFYYYDWRIQ